MRWVTRQFDQCPVRQCLFLFSTNSTTDRHLLACLHIFRPFKLLQTKKHSVLRFNYHSGGIVWKLERDSEMNFGVNEPPHFEHLIHSNILTLRWACYDYKIWLIKDRTELALIGTHHPAFILIDFQLKINKYRLERNLRIYRDNGWRWIAGKSNLRYIQAHDFTLVSIELEKKNLIRFICTSHSLFIGISPWTNKHQRGGQIGSEIYLLYS